MIPPKFLCHHFILFCFNIFSFFRFKINGIFLDFKAVHWFWPLYHKNPSISRISNPWSNQSKIHPIFVHNCTLLPSSKMKSIITEKSLLYFLDVWNTQNIDVQFLYWCPSYSKISEDFYHDIPQIIRELASQMH